MNTTTSVQNTTLPSSSAETPESGSRAVSCDLLQRLAGAAAYLPLAGRLIVLLMPTRNSRQVRFHLFQSSLLGFSSFVLGAGLVPWRRIYVVGMTLRTLAGVDAVVLVALAGTALLARPLTLPGLGQLAHKLAAVRPGWLKRWLVSVHCVVAVSCDTTESGGE